MTSCPALRFRPTRLTDIPALYRVRAATCQNAISPEQLIEWGITPETIAEGFGSGEFYGEVCESAGIVVGFCTGNTKTGEIIVLAVLPEFEKQRIGITLLNGVVAELQRWNLPSIWLACTPNLDSRSHGFYRTNGWLETGKVQENGDEILEWNPLTAA